MPAGTKKLCPGQDSRYWTPDAIYDVTCAACGRVMEFFKDEVSRRCPGCNARVMNPKLNIGCAAWCSQAEKCLGADIAASVRSGTPIAEKSSRDLIIEEMRRAFGADQRRIDHALKVLSFAERITGREGGNRRVITAAAILHDIGILECERTHGSTAGQHQETEGPPIARRILDGLDFPPDAIDDVCAIIAHHHNGKMKSQEFDTVWDADWLVNIPDEHDLSDPKRTMELIDRVFRTVTGHDLAVRTFATSAGKQK